MADSSIKGNISDFEELLKLLKFLGDDIIFKLKCGNEEISIYASKDEFTIFLNNSPIGLLLFKKKLADWTLRKKDHISFSIIPLFEIPPNSKEQIDKETLSETIEQIQYIREIPENFKIKVLDKKNTPEKIKVLEGKELSIDTVISTSSVSILDIIKLARERYIKIEKTSLFEKTAPLIGYLSLSVIVLSTLFTFLPFNKKAVTIVKIQRNMNPIMAKLITGKKIPEKLPAKDGFLNNLYFKNGYIISSGMDRELGTNDDIKVKIPDKIKPLFAIP